MDGAGAISLIYGRWQKAISSVYERWVRDKPEFERGKGMAMG
jgi:hypothetical protein